MMRNTNAMRKRPVLTLIRGGLVATKAPTDLLDMMCAIADDNAKEYREAARARAPRQGDAEWAQFKDRAARVNWLLSGDESEGFQVSDELEEGDAELLLELVDVLKKAKAPLTLAEVTRGLQRNKVLTVEFEAAARARAKWMLGKLRDMRRASVDPHSGRWSFVPRVPR